MKIPAKISIISLFSLVFFSMAWAALPMPANSNGVSEENVIHFENNQKISDFRLDHFKAYAISNQPASATVWLRGQFENGFIKAKLYRYVRFLNPVSKNGEGIIDKFSHLNWFMIETELDPIRKVTFYNQFGLQTIKIGRAVGLLAPAEKLEPGSQFPERLDHYKVYEVISAETVNRQVRLKDQFGSHDNVAYAARYFAVPVDKRHEDGYFPIINKEDHIVFYVIEPKEFNEYRKTRDQFGLHEMKTYYCELLGVPTKKIAWEQ